MPTITQAFKYLAIATLGVVLSSRFLPFGPSLIHGASIAIAANIFITDLSRYRINIASMIAFALFGIAFIFFNHLQEFERPLDATTHTLVFMFNGLAIGFGFFLFGEIYKKLRKRTGLALGDIALFAIAGIWLPLTNFATFVLIAAVSALALVFVRSVSRGKMVKAGTHVPFGGFQALAIWVTVLIQQTT